MPSFGRFPPRLPPERQAVSTVRRAEPLLPLVPVLLIIGVILYFAGLGKIETTSPEFLLMAISAALFVYLLTLVNIQFGLAILIFSVGLSPEMALLGIGNLRVEDFIVPILLVSWATRMVDRSEPFEPTRLKKPIFALLAVGIAASTFGIAFGNLPPLRSLFYFGKNVEYYVIFLLMINLVKTLDEAKAYIVLFLLTGLIVSLQGIFGVGENLIGYSQRRIHGPAGETGNIMGGFLMLVVAVAVGMMIHAPTGGKRLFAAAVGFVTFMAFIRTLSRTSYVALILGLMVYGVLKRRFVFAAVLIALVALPLVVPEDVVGRWNSLLNLITGAGSPPSWDARVISWNQMSHAVYTSPLLGLGVGYYDLGWVDNEYMRVLGEMGFVGVLAFIWLLMTIGRLALTRTNAYPLDPELTGYAAGFFIAYLCMLVHAMGATTFSTIRTMEAFIILLSLRVAIDNHYPAWYPQQPPTPSSAAGPLIAAPVLRALHR